MHCGVDVVLCARRVTVPERIIFSLGYSLLSCFPLRDRELSLNGRRDMQASIILRFCIAKQHLFQSGEEGDASRFRGFRLPARKVSRVLVRIEALFARSRGRSVFFVWFPFISVHVSAFVFPSLFLFTGKAFQSSKLSLMKEKTRFESIHGRDMSPSRMLPGAHLIGIGDTHASGVRH